MFYDFKCPKCEKVEEKSIRISDYDEEKNKQVCSECGTIMERVFSDIGGTKYGCKGFYDTTARNVNFR